MEDAAKYVCFFLYHLPQPLLSRAQVAQVLRFQGNTEEFSVWAGEFLDTLSEHMRSVFELCLSLLHMLDVALELQDPPGTSTLAPLNSPAVTCIAAGMAYSVAPTMLSWEEGKQAAAAVQRMVSAWQTIPRIYPSILESYMVERESSIQETARLNSSTSDSLRLKSHAHASASGIGEGIGMMIEMVVNPHMKERLQRLIDAFDKQKSGVITYLSSPASLSQLVYLLTTYNASLFGTRSALDTAHSDLACYFLTEYYCPRMIDAFVLRSSILDELFHFLRTLSPSSAHLVSNFCTVVSYFLRHRPLEMLRKLCAPLAREGEDKDDCYLGILADKAILYPSLPNLLVEVYRISRAHKYHLSLPLYDVFRRMWLSFHPAEAPCHLLDANDVNSIVSATNSTADGKDSKSDSEKEDEDPNQSDAQYHQAVHLRRLVIAADGMMEGEIPLGQTKQYITAMRFIILKLVRHSEILVSSPTQRIKSVGSMISICTRTLILSLDAMNKARFFNMEDESCLAIANHSSSSPCAVDLEPYTFAPSCLKWMAALCEKVMNELERDRTRRGRRRSKSTSKKGLSSRDEEWNVLLTKYSRLKRVLCDFISDESEVLAVRGGSAVGGGVGSKAGAEESSRGSLEHTAQL